MTDLPSVPLPRVLVIDDVLGRGVHGARNLERMQLCGALLLRDVTGDEEEEGRRIHRPLAEAVFIRGQSPRRAAVGDVVHNDLESCMAAVRSGWSERPPTQAPWSLVILDLCFYTGPVTAFSHRRRPGMPEGRPSDSSPADYFGLKVLSAIQEACPDVPVIILSSTHREDVSRAFSERGALGFLPVEEPDLKGQFRDLLWRHGLMPDQDGRIVGVAPGLLLALRKARRSATSPSSVLIRGEKGTGKELLAAFLHQHSPGRAAKGPLVTVDSGSLSPELYASELFGHRRGAFTGAVGDRKGRIQQADGSDLFLDEIGNMPPLVQSGLMRVLQEHHVVPLGANAGVDVDVRFISATNQDVEARVANGEFKGDLLDRLRFGGTIVLPPLRQRRGDIPLIVRRFFEKSRDEIPGAAVREVSQEALDWLCNLDWEGNVRSLESCVRSAVASHPDVDYLYPRHFETEGWASAGATRAREFPHAAAPRSGSRPDSPRLDTVVQFLEQVELESVDLRELAGALPRLQGAFATLVAKLVRAALKATRRPTLEEPEGRVLIQPAMKLLQGDPTISGSAAADLIKRLIGHAPDGLGDLAGDPVLRDAVERALRLRPKRPKRRAT